jgi:enoyl-CoA hydratase/carnithine racemase
MQVAMHADMRIATEGSQFGIPAAKLGIAYGYEGLRNLVSLVGPSMARLLMFTGKRIPAEEALRIGLIDQLVPEADLAETTLELARTIAANAPLSVLASKVTIASILKDPADRNMTRIKHLGDQCMDSEDFREGRQAFMEKRAPRFTGR